MNPDSKRLVVDRGAANEPLAEDEFRAWARDQRVFISSVMDELREERRAVAERVRGPGALCVAPSTRRVPGYVGIATPSGMGKVEWDDVPMEVSNHARTHGVCPHYMER
jgi:hypothetical protein